MCKSILILEESHIVHELFESIVPERKWGWKFHHESIPENYLQKVKSILPDIIFLSNRDQTRGYQTIKSLSHDHELNLIPIILLTTARDQINEAFLESKGVAGFIQKPFEASTFFAQMERILGTSKHEIKNNPELDGINVIDDELMAILSDKSGHNSGISLDTLENEIYPSHLLQPVESELMVADEFDLSDENSCEEGVSFNKGEGQQPVKKQILIVTDPSLKHEAPILNAPDSKRIHGITELDVCFQTDTDLPDEPDKDTRGESVEIDLCDDDFEIDEILGDGSQNDSSGRSETIKEFELDIDIAQSLNENKNSTGEKDNLLDIDLENKRNIPELDAGKYEVDIADDLSVSAEAEKEDSVFNREEVENLEIDLERTKIILPEIEKERPENVKFKPEDSIKTVGHGTQKLPSSFSGDANEVDTENENEKLAFLELEDSTNTLDEGGYSKIDVNPDIFGMDDFSMDSVLGGSENDSETFDEVDFEKTATLDDEPDPYTDVEESYTVIKDRNRFLDETTPNDDLIDDMVLASSPAQDIDSSRDTTTNKPFAPNVLKQTITESKPEVEELEQESQKTKNYDEIELPDDIEIDKNEDLLLIDEKDMLDDNVDIFEDDWNEVNEDSPSAGVELFKEEIHSTSIEPATENNPVLREDSSYATEEPSDCNILPVVTHNKNDVEAEETTIKSEDSGISQVDIAADVGEERPQVEEIVETSKSEQLAQTDLSNMIEDIISKTIHKTLNETLPGLVEKIVQGGSESS